MQASALALTVLRKLRMTSANTRRRRKRESLEFHNARNSELGTRNSDLTGVSASWRPDCCLPAIHFLLVILSLRRTDSKLRFAHISASRPSARASQLTTRNSDASLASP